MHPLYRPILLIIGLNVLVLLGLQARSPTPPVASRQVDRTSISQEPPPAVAPCEPTVAGNEKQIAERDTVLRGLERRAYRNRVLLGSQLRGPAGEGERDCRSIF